MSISDATEGVVQSHFDRRNFVKRAAADGLGAAAMPMLGEQ
jgi:hypothetical protein